MTRRATLVVAALLVAPLRAAAQPSGQPAAAPSATAYFEFLRGRHLESQGQIAQALDAYRLASEADPASAAIPAEIATLNARANRTEEANKAARHALELDPDNADAHWVLGTILAAQVEGEDEAGTAGTPDKPVAGAPATPDKPAAVKSKADEAIAHLEQARPKRPFDATLALTLGRLYLGQRAWAKARGVLEPVVERDPDHAEAAYLLAQAQIGAGDLEGAAASLDAVSAAEPRFARALIDRADVAMRLRKWDDAAAAFGKAAATLPDNPDLKLRQAAALMRAGKHAEARVVLLATEKARPTDARVQFLLVDVDRQLRDYEAAERAARHVIALEPDRASGYHALAQVLSDRREHRAIVDALAPAIARLEAKEDARSLVSLRVSLGIARLQVREFDAAIADIDRARRDAGGADPGLDALRVQARLEAGKIKDALSIVTAARTTNPTSLRLLGLEAEARLKAGERDRAFALYQQAIDTDGAEADAPIAFAGLLVEAHEYRRAESVLNAARLKFPEETTIPFQLGAVFEEQKRYDDAERAFRDALVIDPKHAPTLNYLGYMLAEHSKKLDEAVKLLEEAVALDPYNGSYLDSLGWAYFKTGAYDRAKTYLLRAGDQLPRNSVIQDHVGDLLFAMADKPGAVAAWRRALDGDGRSIERSAIEKKIEKARAR